jgi:hypothetical protein
VNVETVEWYALGPSTECVVEESLVLRNTAGRYIVEVLEAVRIEVDDLHLESKSHPVPWRAEPPFPISPSP